MASLTALTPPVIGPAVLSMSRFSLIFVAADASHLWTCGSTAAAKAQPPAQDCAQLLLTAASASPAAAEQSPAFAGPAFHAHLSMPWTSGTVIWRTMPAKIFPSCGSAHESCVWTK